MDLSEKIDSSISEIGNITNANAATSEELSAAACQIQGTSERLTEILKIFKL